MYSFHKNLSKVSLNNFVLKAYSYILEQNFVPNIFETILFNSLRSNLYNFSCILFTSYMTH